MKVSTPPTLIPILLVRIPGESRDVAALRNNPSRGHRSPPLSRSLHVTERVGLAGRQHCCSMYRARVDVSERWRAACS